MCRWVRSFLGVDTPRAPPIAERDFGLWRAGHCFVASCGAISDVLVSPRRTTSRHAAAPTSEYTLLASYGRSARKVLGCKAARRFKVDRCGRRVRPAFSQSQGSIPRHHSKTVSCARCSFRPQYSCPYARQYDAVAKLADSLNAPAFRLVDSVRGRFRQLSCSQRHILCPRFFKVRILSS